MAVVTRLFQGLHPKVNPSTHLLFVDEKQMLLRFILIIVIVAIMVVTI